MVGVQARRRSGAIVTTALVAAMAMAATLAGCSAPFPSPMAGTVVTTEQGPSTEGRERWVTTIFLDQGQIVGSADVQVAFFADDLQCDDGEPVPDGPAGLVVGTRLVVDFDPDAPIDTTDPPIVNGLRVTASCPSG